MTIRGRLLWHAFVVVVRSSLFTKTIVFDMGDVDGGDGGDADDSVIATHYVRLLWFFHSCMRFIVHSMRRVVRANFFIA